MYPVISHGLDYLRFRIYNDSDVHFVQQDLPYLDIRKVWHHGTPFIDLTGGMLEVVRLMQSVPRLARDLSIVYRVGRIDVFVDVLGDVLGDVCTDGTEVWNDGRPETKYSLHLSQRGNAGVFCRAYNARAAGHYDIDATRFEVEYKKEYARKMLHDGVFLVDPIDAALRHIAVLTGVYIEIPEHNHIEYDPPTKRYQHDRERFYKRFGASILTDMTEMGLSQLYAFIMECQTEKERDKENERIGEHDKDN